VVETLVKEDYAGYEDGIQALRRYENVIGALVNVVGSVYTVDINPNMPEIGAATISTSRMTVPGSSVAKSKWTGIPTGTTKGFGDGPLASALGKSCGRSSRRAQSRTIWFFRGRVSMR
jgi:hypothetical protein